MFDLSCLRELSSKGLGSHNSQSALGCPVLRFFEPTLHTLEVFSCISQDQLSGPVTLTGAILGLIGRRLPLVPGPFWSRVSRKCDTSTILNGREF